MVPPPITRPAGAIAPKFFDGAPKCEGLAEAFAQVTNELDCPMFDAGSVVTASTFDGVHLDAEAHIDLGPALADTVESLVWPE